MKSLDQQFVDAYEEIGANKAAFNFVCEEFRKKSLRGWGFMEFQYVAMEYMKAFNVHRDVDAYNQLLNMYPRGPLRQTTFFAEAFQLGEQHSLDSAHCYKSFFLLSQNSQNA